MPVALEAAFLRRLQLVAAAQENRFPDWGIVAVQELNADITRRIAATSPRVAALTDRQPTKGKQPALLAGCYYTESNAG